MVPSDNHFTFLLSFKEPFDFWMIFSCIFCIPPQLQIKKKIRKILFNLKFIRNYVHAVLLFLFHSRNRLVMTTKDVLCTHIIFFFWWQEMYILYAMTLFMVCICLNLYLFFWYFINTSVLNKICITFCMCTVLSQNWLESLFTGIDFLSLKITK